MQIGRVKILCVSKEFSFRTFRFKNRSDSFILWANAPFPLIICLVEGFFIMIRIQIGSAANFPKRNCKQLGINRFSYGAAVCLTALMTIVWLTTISSQNLSADRS